MRVTLMKLGITWPLLLLYVLCAGLLSTGCKKQAAAPSQTVQTYEHLPEATNVTAALDQKEYDTAVSALAKLRESVSTEEQQNEFRALLEHVKDKVVEASATDPKAAEAMQTLRVMISGR